MKKFDVEITETLQRKVSVEAASQEDAERMVTQAWNNQDYVLDSGTGIACQTYHPQGSPAGLPRNDVQSHQAGHDAIDNPYRKAEDRDMKDLQKI